MTSPVIPAVPTTARPVAGADASGGTDSAEPFATALDGAMASGRSELGDAGADGEQQGSESEESADGAVPAPATDLPVAPAGGLVAALWARVTGIAGGAEAEGGTGAPGAAGAPGSQVATGRARALEVAAGLAHGLRGLPAGQAPAGSPSGGLGSGGPAGVVPAVPVPAVPVGTGPVLPPPAPAVAEAMASLTAAGVQVVVGAPAGDAPEPVTVVPAPVPAPGTATPPATPPAAADAADALGSPSGTEGSPVAALHAAGAPSGGGPDGRPDGGAERGPAGGALDEAPPVTATAAAPAPSVTGPAPRAESATAPAVAQPVAGQLARSVAVLRGGPDGTHTMTVVLTPEALGPVEVSVTLSHGTVELTLRGAHDHGRAALIDALPELRRDLEAAGLTCSRVDVDRGRDGSSSAQQQSTGRDAGGGRGQQHDRGDTGARPWHRPADNGEGRPATARTASGLDVRV